MLELANHKKTAFVLGVLLCVPMVFIILFAAQFSSAEQIFTDVSRAALILPDGEEMVFTKDADLDLYAGMISRASVVDEPVRDLEGEEPLELTLDSVKYELYLSLSASGCMAVSEKGTVYLLTAEDAAKLMVRKEMSFLYDDSRLPSLKVVSGDIEYGIGWPTVLTARIPLRPWPTRKLPATCLRILKTVCTSPWSPPTTALRPDIIRTARTATSCP